MQAQTLKPFATAQNSSRRTAGITFVVALHAGLITALIVGLAPPDFVQKIVKDIIVVDLPNAPDHTDLPPPPPNHSVQRQVDVPPVDEPTIQYDETPQTVIGGGINQSPAWTLNSSATAHGIMNTHTIPPYPPISIRLNEQGNVTLQVRISETGAVTDAVVTRSSGYPRLDDAAVAWVKGHWRYHAAEQGGVPVASTTSAVVKFELRNAR